VTLDAVVAVRPRLRVIIADDDVSVRLDLRRLLELEDDIEVVAVAHDGQHCVDQCRLLEPDVVILDIRMPVLDGISATRIIRSVTSSTKRPAVVILTTFDLDEYVLGAIREGASGFLLKDQAPEQLAGAVRTVAGGEAILAPSATLRLMQTFAQPQVTPTAKLEQLTKREFDVLKLVAQGRSNEAIAEALFISIPTVKTHMSNLLTKLELDNRVQAVVWAYEHRVVVAV
jgi:DNA-binding NarL/FixJ family response regulator